MRAGSIASAVMPAGEPPHAPPSSGERAVLGHPPAFAGRSGRVHRAGQRFDEILELVRRPTLKRLAVTLVGRDNRVAVVPVQPWLWIKPERAPRGGRYLGEDVGARIAPVGTRIAEDDHRRARMQVVL